MSVVTDAERSCCRITFSNILAAALLASTFDTLASNTGHHLEGKRRFVPCGALGNKQGLLIFHVQYEKRFS